MTEREDNPIEETDIALEELQWRVIYSLFRPVVRMAGTFGLSLRDLKEWLGVSYLHELKRKGLTQSESADAIGVSRRTIISLARKLRDNFFEPERHQSVQRRILFMLWAESMSIGRLYQALEEDAPREDVDDALDELEAVGFISREEHQGTAHYSLERCAFRLYRDDWIARIDALNNQLDHISDTVFARFFTRDKSSFARTVTFSIRARDKDALERLYREVIFPELARLDEQAEGADDAEHMELSLSWAPKDFMSNHDPLSDDVQERDDEND